MLTLLSVSSPSCIFISCGAPSLPCPVTSAKCSTRAVLPQPTGPSSNAGRQEDTARARLRRLRRVVDTGTNNMHGDCHKTKDSVIYLIMICKLSYETIRFKQLMLNRNKIKFI